MKKEEKGCEDGGKDLSDIATCQEKPRTASKWERGMEHPEHPEVKYYDPLSL